MHFNGRPAHKVVVMNVRKGKWGKEVRFPWPNIRVGQKMVIIIKVLPNGYHFEVNGLKIKARLPHRIPFKKVSRVQFVGPKGTWTSIHRSKSTDFTKGAHAIIQYTGFSNNHLITNPPYVIVLL